MSRQLSMTRSERQSPHMLLQNIPEVTPVNIVNANQVSGIIGSWCSAQLEVRSRPRQKAEAVKASDSWSPLGPFHQEFSSRLHSCLPLSPFQLDVTFSISYI